ncbi:fibronectin type III domain-containing protein [Marivirga sp. S37H4]|uniref:Fibronectin type III domain-containing protein n=1 Tax=Marivirga aurantiaca TaxID=2802615 RepID=A0A935C9K5_9BACT|nr:fibronectin type III domain-containing protein [Marivirga aurantiaca]MBK6264313.1 fibronectin type III domain-containing protein [Marivirga aurantiaca]
MKKNYGQLALPKKIRLSKIPFLLTILISFYVNSLYAQQDPRIADNGMGYLEYLPPDYESNNKLYPAIIFLHGHGERGNGSPSALEAVKKHGPPKLIKNGEKMCFEVNGKTECFIVLSPQQGNNRHGWKGYEVIPFVQYALNKYRIDPDRVYLTGLSMGGQGTWETAYSEENEPNYFAALAPVAGKGSFTKACIVAEKEIPVWGFHGANDNAIGLSSGEKPINGMIACGANPAPIFTIYAGVGHSGSWDRAYKTNHSIHSPNLYEWMLSQSRDGTTGGNPPKAPTQLRASNTTSEQFTLKWEDNSNNENGFEIERSLNSNNGFSVIKSTSRNTRSYSDKNLEPNTTYYYKVRAKNSDGYSSYSNKLTARTNSEIPNTPNNTSIVIDNNSGKVTTSGNWATSSSGGNKKHKNNYFHDRNSGKGNKKVVFNTDLPSGSYEVFAWWFAHSNRASNTPFDIESDEGTTTVVKNQRNDGGKWVSLGVYDFTNNAKISIRNTNTNGYVVADAIKFESVTSSPGAPDNNPVVIIDNIDSGVEPNNNWTISQSGGTSKYGDDYFHDGNRQKGNKDIVYTASVSPGNYEVFARWFAHSNRATNTHYEILSSDGVADVYKNQRLNNARWVSLGEYSFDNEAEITVKNDNTNGYVVADAFKLVPTGNNASRASAPSPNLISEVEEDSISSDEIVVYPNPVKELMNIKSPFEESKVFHLKIMGASGGLEWNETVEGRGSIPVSLAGAGLTKGIKYLRIEMEGQAVKILRIMIL